MKKLFIFYMITMSILMGCVTSANAMSADSIRSYIYCVEGYKFLYTFSSNSSASLTATQIYKKWNNFGNPPVPMECDGSEPKQIKRGPVKY